MLPVGENKAQLFSKPRYTLFQNRIAEFNNTHVDKGQSQGLHLTRHCEERSDMAIWLGPDDWTVAAISPAPTSSEPS